MNVEVGYDQFGGQVITCRQESPKLSEQVTAGVDLIGKISGVQLGRRRHAVGTSKGTGGASAAWAGGGVLAYQDGIFRHGLIDSVVERTRGQGKQRRQPDDGRGDPQLGPEIEPDQR